MPRKEFFRVSAGILSLLMALMLLHALTTAWPASAEPRPWRGRVTKVFDGDSMIIDRKGRPVEVRVFGVDCPEKGQPWADQARRFTRRLKGCEVLVKPVTVDRHHRVVAKLEGPDNKDHGLRLIEKGLAWWYRRYASRNDRYRLSESAARAARRGLWSQKDPVPPWRWRRQEAGR